MSIREKILKSFGKIAHKIGAVLNQNLTDKEKGKIKAANYFQLNPKKIFAQPKKKKIKIQKEIYQHKGSGFKGKGGVNTDAALFNRARKDIPRGREA
jgi:hypothetical protein